MPIDPSSESGVRSPPTVLGQSVCATRFRPESLCACEKPMPPGIAGFTWATCSEVIGPAGTFKATDRTQTPAPFVAATGPRNGGGGGRNPPVPSMRMASVDGLRSSDVPLGVGSAPGGHEPAATITRLPAMPSRRRESTPGPVGSTVGRHDDEPEPWPFTVRSFRWGRPVVCAMQAAARMTKEIGLRMGDGSRRGHGMTVAVIWTLLDGALKPGGTPTLIAVLPTP